MFVASEFRDTLRTAAFGASWLNSLYVPPRAPHYFLRVGTKILLQFGNSTPILRISTGKGRDSIPSFVFSGWLAAQRRWVVQSSYRIRIANGIAWEFRGSAPQLTDNFPYFSIAGSFFG